MEIPPPDPKKLLLAWTEWERGEVTPGRAMANLKTAGMPALLQSVVARLEEEAPAAPSVAGWSGQADAG